MASFSTDEVPIPIAMEVQAMALSTSELEVIQWLQSINFERHQQNFITAGIFSLAIVCDIESEDDLQELGIPKIPARTLMKHILELKENGFTAPPPEGSAGTGEEDDDALKKEKKNKKDQEKLPEETVDKSKDETSTTTTRSPTRNPGGPQPKTKSSSPGESKTEAPAPMTHVSFFLVDVILYNFFLFLVCFFF